MAYAEHMLFWRKTAELTVLSGACTEEELPAVCLQVCEYLVQGKEQPHRVGLAHLQIRLEAWLLGTTSYTDSHLGWLPPFPIDLNTAELLDWQELPECIEHALCRDWCWSSAASRLT